MSRLVDYPPIGTRFGHLTVIAHLPRRNRHTFVRCTCDCGAGKVTEPQVTLLRSGRAVSCGCVRRQTFMEAIRRAAPRGPRHDATPEVLKVLPKKPPGRVT